MFYICGVLEFDVFFVSNFPFVRNPVRMFICCVPNFQFFCFWVIFSVFLLYIQIHLCRLESSSTSLQTSGVREAYLARRRALRQFNFIDPFGIDIIVEAKPFDHLLMDKTNIYFSQVYTQCSRFCSH